MKKREMMGWVLVAVTIGVMFAWRRPEPVGAKEAGGESHFAQISSTRGAPMPPAGGNGAPSDAALRAIGDKLDLIQNSNAGRYVFVLSGAKGEYLVRIDRVRGELAFLDDSGSAKWVTLSIFEERIDTTSPKFKPYVESLRNVRPL